MARASNQGLWPNAFILLGLSGLAITQPTLDLLGGSPDFFVASGTRTPEFLGLALLVATLPTGLLLLLEWIASLASPRIVALVHTAAVTLLAFLLGLLLARSLELERTSLALVVGGLTALTIVGLQNRFAAARSFLRWLAIGPVISLGIFLVNSPAAEVLWARDPALEQGIEIGRPAPVVLLIFDELSLASLLDDRGTVNRERFPNFAQLADQSLWFRNATAVSPETARSVPSILAGKTPALDWSPTLARYPRNLFTLLAEHYDITAVEQAGRLCPERICRAETRDLHAFSTLLLDAGIALGHRVLPFAWSAALPPIDQAWGNFLGRNASTSDLTERHLQIFSAALHQGNRWRATIAQIRRSRRPQLIMIHTLLPHVPWQITPSGIQYATDWGMAGWDRKRRRVDHPAIVAQGYQRHLMQVGFVDRLLGELMDQLKSQSLWDESLVVLTADHGVAFLPGHPRRDPDHIYLLDDIYRVPLMIKLPEQEKGEIRDDPAVLIDILPTIMEVLEARTPTPWPLDGRSLVGDTAPPSERSVVWHTKAKKMPIGLRGLFKLVERRSALVSHSGGWEMAVAPSDRASAVGLSLEALEIAGTAYEFEVNHPKLLQEVDRASGFLPLLVQGRLFSPVSSTPSSPEPDHILLAVNGRVAGVGILTDRKQEHASFSGVLSEDSLVDGPNAFALLVPASTGGATQYWQARPRDAVYALREEPGGEPSSLLLPDGTTLPVIAASARHPMLAQLPAQAGAPVVSGWSGNVVDKTLPHTILLFAGTDYVGTARLGPTRDDVRDTRENGVHYQLFQIQVPSSLANAAASRLRALALYPDRAVMVEVQ